MKVKQNYVSSQYHQVYFTFTVSEMNNIFEEVLTDHGISYKDAKKKFVTELVMEKIEDEIIDDELMKLDVIVIGNKRFRYLTSVSRDFPLIVITQFCILPTDLSMNFPKKIPSSLFEIPYIDELIDNFTKQILIMNDEYELVDGDVLEQGSIVKYDLSYSKDDFIISEINDQELTLDDVTQNDRAIFLGHKIGDEIVLDDNDDVKVTAKIKKITNLSVKLLTDEIVRDLNFLNTKTVHDFRLKIIEIFTFSTSTVILLNYLADFVANSGVLKFDDYVINHVLEDEDTPKKKKDREQYIEELKIDLTKEYICWVINLASREDDSEFTNKIMEEYEFDKILFNNPMRIDDYQEYIARHKFEGRVLIYCIENNIIDLKI